MLGSEILEIAIGVVFTFLLLSLTASTVRETFEGLLKTRAIQLERGLREMLDDPTGTGITKQLFDHPLLFGLFPGQYDPRKLTSFFISRGTFVKVVNGSDTTEEKQRVRFHSNLPAYIPSRNFAMALLDLASKKSGGAALSLDAVRQTAVTLQNERLRSALLVAIGEAEGDIDRARTSLEAWFDGTMDRVSGWYKRETQWLLLALGLFLAVALNVDCLHVAHSLALNNTVRQKIIQTVESDDDNLQQAAPAAASGASQNPAATDTPAFAAASPVIPQEEVNAQLSGLSDIIGWPQLDQSVTDQVKNETAAAAKVSAAAKLQHKPPPAETADGWWGIWIWYVVLSIPGWLISALAVSLGAPFWFDVLNKLMVVRSTVKPYEKSPSEGSDDRKPGVTAANLLAPQPAKPADGNDGSPPQTSDPDAPASTVAIRVAFDVGTATLMDLTLAVDGGAPQPVPSPYMVEVDVVANVPHTLTAKATAGGAALTWDQDVRPGLDDDGWPILAELA